MALPGKSITEEACMRAGSKREPDLEACRPIPSEAEAGGFQPVPGQPGLYSEFGDQSGLQRETLICKSQQKGAVRESLVSPCQHNTLVSVWGPLRFL